MLEFGDNVPAGNTLLVRTQRRLCIGIDGGDRPWFGGGGRSVFVGFPRHSREKSFGGREDSSSVCVSR